MNGIVQTPHTVHDRGGSHRKPRLVRNHKTVEVHTETIIRAVTEAINSHAYSRFETANRGFPSQTGQRQCATNVIVLLTIFVCDNTEIYYCK